MGKPGGIQPATPTIDIDVTTRIKPSPSVGVLAHHPDGQLLGDPVIEAEADSAGGKVLAVGIPIGIHTDKVAEAGYPDTPAVFRCMLEHWFHHVFGGLSIRIDSVLQIHGGTIYLHVGAKAVRSVANLVQPIFQIQSLDV